MAENVYNWGNKYSTEEQIVGEWIDGKPLYQKTYYKDSDISNGWNILGTLPTGCTTNTVKSINGMAITNISLAYPFSCYNGDSEIALVVVDSSGVDVRLNRVDTTWTNIFVTIQYTKTTD